MAIKTFRAVSGQSILDVCLNTYGSLNLLYKLVQDNNIQDINQLVSSRQPFIYDTDLVIDSGLNQTFEDSGIKYATDVSNTGSIFYSIDGQPGSGSPNPPPSNQNDNVNSVYSQSDSTHFTSGADGTTVVTLQTEDGGSMIGFDIIQIEDEIKPLTPAQFSWNKATSVLTLLAGLTLDAGKTIFILYRQTITV